MAKNKERSRRPRDRFCCYLIIYSYLCADKKNKIMAILILFGLGALALFAFILKKRDKKIKENSDTFNKKLLEILKICCVEFDVTIEQVRSSSRKQEYIYTRKAFALLIKENYDLKNDTIAKMLNKTGYDVGYYMNKQPTDNYYITILNRIKKRISIEKRDSKK
jgi:hypothetical protein